MFKRRLKIISEEYGVKMKILSYYKKNYWITAKCNISVVTNVSITVNFILCRLLWMWNTYMWTMLFILPQKFCLQANGTPLKTLRLNILRSLFGKSIQKNFSVPFVHFFIFLYKIRCSFSIIIYTIAVFLPSCLTHSGLWQFLNSAGFL